MSGAEKSASTTVPIEPHVLWMDKTLALGIVNWDTFSAQEQGRLYPIEAKELHPLGDSLKHRSWDPRKVIQVVLWQRALFLAKSLAQDPRAAQQYWTAKNGYLFLVLEDARKKRIAVAIAPLDTMPSVPIGSED